ncbi:Hypothetical protein NocV09_00100010, partial [Nannochloropsis oceanica]
MPPDDDDDSSSFFSPFSSSSFTSTTSFSFHPSSLAASIRSFPSPGSPSSHSVVPFPQPAIRPGEDYRHSQLPQAQRRSLLREGGRRDWQHFWHSKDRHVGYDFKGHGENRLSIARFSIQNLCEPRVWCPHNLTTFLVSVLSITALTICLLRMLARRLRRKQSADTAIGRLVKYL